MTMLELMGVLIIASLLVVGYLSYMRIANDSRRAVVAAEHAKTLIPAVQAYVKANSAALEAAATPSNAVTITPAQLFAGTALEQGFAPTNAYGQSFVVRVNEPVAGRLDALILYTGGRQLDYSEMREVADLVGFAGGFVSSENPAIATGGRGQWTKQLANFGGSQGVGRLAIGVFADSAKQVDDYLHRTATGGRPELNRMSTAINMANNNLDNAGTVTGANVNASNGVQANALALGKAAFGAVSYPYETIQTGAANNLRLNVGTREIATFGADGVTRMNGDSSTAGSFYANGNIAANGRVSGSSMQTNESYVTGYFRVQGNGGLYWENHGGGFYMSDASWIRAFGNKGIVTGGEMQAGSLRSTGNLQVDGRATVNEFLQINGVAARNTGCGPNGLIGRESSGSALFCTNGVWRSASGPTTGAYVGRGSSTGAMAGVNNSGYTSFITVAVAGSGTNNYGATVTVAGAFLGQITNYNRDFAKYATASFPVPNGASWQISPLNANSSRTQISVTEYVQQ
ncbi:shufflon system plasmid conjugative transfer pilus tip adhesin PilV [Xanthomonas perforans]|uniref:shufflon system plasmid conjugative transfer pilus tip adhesin PilV n=1 Tax=Xanthomonas perforans TaxID=442694 RepID=UPI00235A3C6F|nr:shufflon system plasmid conjugative transfer pilus tip adhesin PilV [Xanthomonas perforans]MDC9654334.1 shufflon system plasmid conjugative transfer pilus tip adhesin PilV [Xanthomonas perforans]MEB2158985.1 shufflon system plasmid conjugative transfer pilus tip adhesin PilV [Xanthomonas campestris pv. campestris]